MFETDAKPLFFATGGFGVGGSSEVRPALLLCGSLAAGVAAIELVGVFFYSKQFVVLGKEGSKV